MHLKRGHARPPAAGQGIRRTTAGLEHVGRTVACRLASRMERQKPRWPPSDEQTLVKNNSFAN